MVADKEHKNSSENKTAASCWVKQDLQWHVPRWEKLGCKEFVVLEPGSI